MDSKLAARFSRMGYLRALQTVNWCELAYNFHPLEASWSRFGQLLVASCSSSWGFWSLFGGFGRGTVTFFRCQDDFWWFWDDFGTILGCQNVSETWSGRQTKWAGFSALIFNTFLNDFQVEFWIRRKNFHVMGEHRVSHMCTLHNVQNYCKIQYFWKVLAHLTSLFTESLRRLCLQKGLQIWLCERIRWQVAFEVENDIHFQWFWRGKCVVLL